MTRKLLVTGATGGLGVAVTRAALARGHQVRATGRSRTKGALLVELGAEFMPLDLVEAHGDLPSLLEGRQSVIHAAALSSSWGAHADFDRINVQATRHLLDAAATAGCERFVFISSPSIFAAFRDRLDIGLDDAPAARPLNPYASTKLAAERMVLAANGALACCAIRPRALVGEGDTVILPRLATLARRKRVPLPRGGRAMIELTDLRDAAEAALLAEQHADVIGGRAINVSGGRPVAVRDVARSLAAALGCEPRLINLPPALARPLAFLSEALAELAGSKTEPALTRYTLATLGYSQTFDQAPAARLLGYRPQYDALETLLSEARKLAATEAAP